MSDIKLSMIKYKGTSNFFSALLYDSSKEEENYYFYFMPTEKPNIEIKHETEYAYSAFNIPLMTLDKDAIRFTANGIPFVGNKKIFTLIKIKKSEFDSMYKLLECIYDE